MESGSMLTVKTYLATSEIHGMGLFAAEDILKGTIMWVHNPILDHKIVKSSITDPVTIEYLETYAYTDHLGLWNIGIGNDHFTNHSLDPNQGWLEEDKETSIALRDIKRGEEITENYDNFGDSQYNMAGIE